MIQIGMERIEFLNSFISNTTGKDSKNIKPNSLVAAYHFIIKKIL